jgi:protein-tyrosine phosphatase
MSFSSLFRVSVTKVRHMFRIFAAYMELSAQLPLFILKSQPNFRDVGGMEGVNGRKVKKEILFRSGALHKLTDDDILRLANLGIKQIVDFRSDREREPRPDKKIPTVEVETNLPIIDGIHEVVQESFENADAEVLKIILGKEYRRMVVENSDAFRRFFHILANTNALPLVFHCAMGKDRTGLAGYFLLHSLGVPEDQNRKHYLESNEYLSEYIDELIIRFTEPGKDGRILRPLLQVSNEYLDAGLDEINKNYGSLENYICSELEVDVERLRALYLD